MTIHLKGYARKLRELRVPSLLLLVFGFMMLALVIVAPLGEKIVIVLGTVAQLLVLLGIWFLNRPDCSIYAPPSSRSWTQYLPLLLGLLAFLCVPKSLTIAALGFAASAASLFIVSRNVNVRVTYATLSIVFIGTLIGYIGFYFYPSVQEVDSLATLAVTSAIIRRGHYSDIVQPTDSYYFPFPVISIASSALSLVSQLNSQTSLLLFPGALMLLQPLLAFLVCRAYFHDVRAALSAALVVLSEFEAYERYLSAPMAHSVAISIVLLVLMLLSVRRLSGARVLTVSVLFAMLVATNGAAGLVSLILISCVILRERPSHKAIIPTLLVILFGYITSAAVLGRVVLTGELGLTQAFNFLLGIGMLTHQILYAGGNGLFFVWWGLPASLAIFALLVIRKRELSTWAYLGIGLLVVSFVANLVVPDFILDRYGGLPALFILAISGGVVLSQLARSSRQLLIVVSLLFLVSLSGVLNAYVLFASPEYASTTGYQGLFAPTAIDETALDWTTYNVRSVACEVYAAKYLTFDRYRSGYFSDEGIQRLQNVITDTVPPPDAALLLRCYNTFVACGDRLCRLPSPLTGQASEGNNVLYDNSCDILLAKP